MLQVLTRLRRQMKNIEDRPSLAQHVAIYTQESSNRFDIQAAACVYMTDPSNKKADVCEHALTSFPASISEN